MLSHIAFSEIRRLTRSFCNHHPGVDCVHADFARAEFFRQCSRDSVDCALRGVVNHRSRWSQGTGERTDVDDAAAVGVEMLERFLSGEEHSENVCIKHFVELLLGDVLRVGRIRKRRRC